MAKKESMNVTMRVRIGENELEITGPSDFVEKKIAEFLEKQKSVSATSTQSSPPQFPALPGIKVGKGMSVAQFFRKVSSKSDVDRALAAGYFLEKFENVENFTASEIRETIRKAKIPPPKNPSDSISKNIKKGFMMTAGDKEGKMAFVLTTDGEEAIASFLNA